ncbi:MAG: hypothetical protein WDN29_06855 [Methylovirgula sp.]
MLSKAAFNGLLKTLEEPPDHVKFHLRDDGDRESAGDGALALSAFRSAPH